MSSSGASRGGGTTFTQGTAAAKPAATPNALYYATDTGEWWVANAAGNAWQSLKATSATRFQLNASGLPVGIAQVSSTEIVLQNANQGNEIGTGNGSLAMRNYQAAAEVAGATAGGGAALPATVAGYFTVQDSAGTARKIPYYAN